MSTAEYSLSTGAADPFSQDPSVQAAMTPIWREAMFPFDWMALRASPIYWGCGVPMGQGEPVVVVPGFLASDDASFITGQNIAVNGGMAFI